MQIYQHYAASLIKTLRFSNPQRIIADILNACEHGTYVETVSKSADTIHATLDNWDMEFLFKEYSRICENTIRKKHLGLCDVCIDITEEKFYGKIKGLWIHPWTGEKGVQGHFKFLVSSVKYRDRKFFLGARILRIGADISQEIGYLMQSCQRAGLLIRTVLLDRGFYSADVIRELKERNEFYLIFAKKSALFQNMLNGTKQSVNIEHEMILNKDKTKTRIKTDIALVKNVWDYDWIFATNTTLSGAEIVRRYMIRWNIETDFRVQDEARIKSKSKRPEVRLFYFLISLLLVFIWNLTEKFRVTFKKFVIVLSENYSQWRAIQVL